MRPPRPAVLLFVSVIAAASFNWACATPVAMFPLASDDPRPRALVEGWDEMARQRRSLRARATLAVDGDDLRFRLRQVLVLERPSRLRVEVLGFLDQTAAVLVIDGERYEFFSAQDRTYENGEVHEGLLWQYTRIDLSPDEAIDLLLGAPILDRTLHPTRATASEAGAVFFDLADERDVVRERVGFDPAGRLTELEVRNAAGALEWRARFQDYAEVEGKDVAHTIVIDGSVGETRAEIALRDIELAPDIPSGLFQLRAR